MNAQVSNPVEPRYDRGTLLLRGIASRPGWTSDPRVRCLRHHAIVYAQQRASLLAVFGVAAKHQPLVTQPEMIFKRSEVETKSAIAVQLGRSWPEIESTLYRDNA